MVKLKLMDHARPIIILNMLILVLVAVVAAQSSFKNKQNYTSIDPKQHQSMLPRRSCAIQNSLMISTVTYLDLLLISKFIG